MFADLDFFPDYCMIFSAVVFGFLIYGGVSVALGKRDVARLLRLEQKIDLLLSRAGLEFASKYDLPEEAIEALREGNDQQAIEAYRMAKGIDLEQARKHIEEVKKAGYF